MRIFCLLLLLSFIDQIDQATAQTPLFDSGASSIIGGAVLSQDTGLASFIDLTATVTPVPELPLGHYLLLSAPLIFGLALVRRSRSRAV